MAPKTFRTEDLPHHIGQFRAIPDDTKDPALERMIVVPEGRMLIHTLKLISKYDLLLSPFTAVELMELMKVSAVCSELIEAQFRRFDVSSIIIDEPDSAVLYNFDFHELFTNVRRRMWRVISKAEKGDYFKRNWSFLEFLKSLSADEHELEERKSLFRSQAFLHHGPDFTTTLKPVDSVEKRKVNLGNNERTIVQSRGMTTTIIHMDYSGYS